jgi:hypothetical protein
MSAPHALAVIATNAEKREVRLEKDFTFETGK